MTVKTVLCGGSLGQDPVVLLGSLDTSLSSQDPSYLLSHHVPSPSPAWSLQSLREALHPSHRPALVLLEMRFSSSRALLLLMGKEKTTESLVFPLEAAFPGLCRGKKATKFVRPLTICHRSLPQFPLG